MDACTGQSDVHSRPFAFRQPEEDDESVKMSKITSGRSSALSPALRASRPLQNRQFLFIQINHFPILQLTQNTSFFLFDANERLPRTPNLAIRTKQITSPQITSFFLFATNERSPITTHQSLIFQ
jgi:hypothetical protein